ncbi:uncharacterized protein METZ01_LOCUS359808 [marine metagenome]|uniref:Uncharacterized protein n=1 Tax=marine metagenome TaxID=408172 RepID=A0A382SAM4_9ZZZZ
MDLHGRKPPRDFGARKGLEEPP